MGKDKFRTLDKLIEELIEIRKQYGDMPTEVTNTTMSFNYQCMVVERGGNDTCLIW